MSYPARTRSSRRARLALAGCACAALIGLLSALPAAAVPISFSGTFDDPTAPEADGDPFSLTNDASPLSQSNITQVVIDLSTSTTPPVTFDPSVATGDPFTITLDPGTGFVSAVFSGGNTVLTLTFTDFNPGETFAFTVDADDNNTRVDSARIAGATITATFAVAGGTDLAAQMIDPPGAGRNTTWSASSDVPVPEPASLPLVGLGLLTLALHRRAARRR